MATLSTVLVALLIAAICGLIAWLIARILPFTARHAEIIGLVVFILVALLRLGA